MINRSNLFCKIFILIIWNIYYVYSIDELIPLICENSGRLDSVSLENCFNSINPD